MQEICLKLEKKKIVTVAYDPLALRIYDLHCYVHLTFRNYVYAARTGETYCHIKVRRGETRLHQ